ncbi:MAG: alpha-L-fucosidase [Lentisphaeria bacterium]|nr:alpha-L-fucosidase [Lentisphaeria bacterium]
MSSSAIRPHMQWFNDARLGIYIHYGLYSILGRGEWTMYSERIPAKEYAQLADRFFPAPRCAEEWIETACAAGAKYMVLTTRHHEGFCLFDSKYSDFTSAKCGCKRDIVAEYVEAARKAGLRVGLYYSLLNWRNPGYFEPEKYPESYQEMIDTIHKQVRELMTNYGKIDLLEYDGGWDAKLTKSRAERAAFWRSHELNAMVRVLQPGIIINERACTDEDIVTPEQEIRAGEGKMSESCMCIGDSCAWGYTRFNPNWKTPVQLIQNLVIAAQCGGNYLLNIGPAADGHIRNEEYTRLSVLGHWLKRHEEAIRSSESCDLIGSSRPGIVDLNLQGPWTRKGNIGYWCIFRWPGRTATAVKVGTPVKKVTLLNDSKELPFEWSPVTKRLKINGLPALPPDDLCSVIKVEFEDVPQLTDEPDLAAWING